MKRNTLCAVLVLALLSGCRLIQGAANAPSNLANSLFGKSKPKDPVPPGVLQGGVMRFADTFASRLAQATQDFAKLAGTPEAQIQAHSWAVGQTTSAFTIAAGVNPNINLLDMLVLVTLGRMTHEEYWGPKVWGASDKPMLDAFTALETDAWDIAKIALTEKQQESMRKTLRDWRDQNPDMGVTAYVRLPTFEDILADSKAQTDAESGGGLGDLLSLDPFSGLDPTTKQLEQARLFAERALYYGERIPIVLSTQVELLTLKLMQMPEVRAALADSERVSKAAASLAETATKLPEVVRAEREATLKQVSEELSAQRAGIVSDLEKVEAPTRELLAQARATLESGTQMSASLKGAVESFDSMMAHLNAEPKSPSTEPAQPFVVGEYGEAATKLGAAAHELNGLFATFDKSLPQMQRALDESAARADQSLERARDRALLYGALLIVAAACATLLVRWISRRWLGARPSA